MAHKFSAKTFDKNLTSRKCEIKFTKDRQKLSLKSPGATEDVFDFVDDHVEARILKTGRLMRVENEARCLIISSNNRVKPKYLETSDAEKIMGLVNSYGALWRSLQTTGFGELVFRRAREEYTDKITSDAIVPRKTLTRALEWYNFSSDQIQRILPPQMIDKKRNVEATVSWSEFRKGYAECYFNDTFTEIAGVSRTVVTAPWWRKMLCMGSVRRTVPPDPMEFDSLAYYCKKRSIVASAEKVEIDDMNYPLCHYFIASSHNTYIVSNNVTSQLSGESSNCGYRLVLEANCKLLEVDLWDGKNGQPDCTHGKTMCTKIPALHVFQAIETHLRSRKDVWFPLIVTLENHCSFTQQKLVADQIKQCLHNWLYTDADHEKLKRDFKTLPSPNDLKRKVLIRGTANPEKTEPSLLELTFLKGQPFRTTAMHSFLTEETDRATTVEKPADTTVTTSVAADSFQKWNVPQDHLKLVKLRDMNGTTVNKIYPEGKRVDSSNYNPVGFWGAGYHIVALNYQQIDKFCNLNRGFFEQNGGVGYVLKPNSVMNNSRVEHSLPRGKTLSLRRSSSKRKNSTKTDKNNGLLEISVLAGFWLYSTKDHANSIPDVKVKVELFAADGTSTAYETYSSTASGYFVRWNPSTFGFKVVDDISMVQFTVESGLKKVIAQRAVAVKQLNSECFAVEPDSTAFVGFLGDLRTPCGGILPRSALCMSIKWRQE